MPEEHRGAVGITDELIRLSIGLENIDDLIDDLRRALESS
jgi:cystathionine beta-lyase/cystathionine gamma-synthase